jgi:hypothetical protein
VGRFAFEDVPNGSYRLLVFVQDSPFQIVPTEVVVSPSAGPLEFVIHDDVPTSDVVFRAHRADTGEPIPDFTAWYRPAHGWGANSKEATEGEALVSGYPHDRPFVWVVGRTGFELAEGDQSDLTMEGETRVAECSLRPGWGGQFFVSEPGEDRNGIEGLWLLCDGVRVGPTRVEGRLPISLPQRPERIELASSGWHIVGGDADATSGELDVAQWWAISVLVARV